MQRYTAEEWAARPADRYDLGGTPEQREAAREIVRRVAGGGDAALRELGQRYDGWAPPPGEDWALRRPALERALVALPADQRAALELAAARIRAFHEAETYADVQGPDGLELLVRPVRRAGLYVPRGRVPYPSTALMTAIPAPGARVPA